MNAIEFLLRSYGYRNISLLLKNKRQAIEVTFVENRQQTNAGFIFLNTATKVSETEVAPAREIISINNN